MSNKLTIDELLIWLKIVESTVKDRIMNSGREKMMITDLMSYHSAILDVIEYIEKE